MLRLAPCEIIPPARFLGAPDDALVARANPTHDCRKYFLLGLILATYSPCHLAAKRGKTARPFNRLDQAPCIVHTVATSVDYHRRMWLMRSEV